MSVYISEFLALARSKARDPRFELSSGQSSQTIGLHVRANPMNRHRPDAKMRVWPAFHKS